MMTNAGPETTEAPTTTETTAPTTTVELVFRVAATANNADWQLAFGTDLATNPDDLRDYVSTMAHGIEHDGVFGNGEVDSTVSVTTVDPRLVVTAQARTSAEELITVTWVHDDGRYVVHARESADEGWTSLDGDETELAKLLALAHDIATGG